MYHVLQCNNAYAVSLKESTIYNKLIKRGFKVIKSGSYRSCIRYAADLQALLLTPKQINNDQDIEALDIRENS